MLHANKTSRPVISLSSSSTNQTTYRKTI